MGTGRRTVLAGGAGLVLSACVPAAPKRPVKAPLDLTELEARHGGRIGLALFDAGQQVTWRADERFVYASTFKLFLAAAILQRVGRGEEDLSRLVDITAEDMVSHAPHTAKAVGGQMSIEALCQATVEDSDNPAANILIREMGGLEALARWYASMGDTVTRVDRWETELNRPDGDKDTATPGQAVTNLNRLRGDVFSPSSGGVPRLLMWCSNDRAPDRIRAGLPKDQGLVLVHKTGTGADGITNEIGYLVPKGGGRDQAMTLAIYYHPARQITAAQGDAVVADATRLALACLGHG